MKKVLNLTNHKGNTNENHNEMLPHIHQNAYNQKENITNVSKDVEKLEPSYIAGRNVQRCSNFGKQFGSFSKS